VGIFGIGGADMTDVQEMIARIIGREGGYVNHPSDHGGPTNMGVTLDALSEYRGVGVTAADIKNLTREEAEAIFYERYWVDPGFDQLNVSSTVAEMLLDMSVHHGAFGAAKLLQKAVNVIPDGQIGAITEKAVNGTRGPILAAAVMGERIAKLGSIITKNPSQAVFAAGWMNRMKELVNRIPNA
jgi:lysozyme family protein